MARSSTYRRGLGWRVLETHYLSRQAFLSIFRAYETRVAKLVDELGVAREDIKLNPDETRLLFDTDPLNDLIARHVQPLRERSHAYFRDHDVAEPFDSEVSQIYHELSILREEHLSVRDFPHTGGRTFARLFQEVSKYYPQRLRRVRDLFTRAQRRLEELLPGFKDDPIVLRSAFLFREELWPENPRSGIVRFLGKMYVDEGVAHGFLCIARSFFKGGFYNHAMDAARMGVAAAGKIRGSRTQMRELVRELDKLVARAIVERKALDDLTA